MSCITTSGSGLAVGRAPRLGFPDAAVEIMQPPIVDITGLREGSDAALQRVAADLVEPCQRWGLFHIAGHGISESLMAAFGRQMEGFFARSAADKRVLGRSRHNARGYYDEELTKNQPDWKEVFDYGAERSAADPDGAHSDGVNQWPADAPEFRETLLAYHQACAEVANRLLRALAVSLGLEASTFDPFFRRASSFVRLNHYAACTDAAPPDAPLFPSSGRLGVYHHTDAGALTLLYQDQVAGLQGWFEGGFHTIEPVPGALTVNLADMLQVWSNDRYRSPLHRVVADPTRSRFSAPFFLNPDYDAVCEPLPGLLRSGEPRKYQPVSWAHFRDQRSAGDYADQGKEIQIEDFRI